MQSVKRTTETQPDIEGLSRPFHGLRRQSLAFPAMNRWATVNRPLSRTGSVALSGARLLIAKNAKNLAKGRKNASGCRETTASSNSVDIT